MARGGRGQGRWSPGRRPAPNPANALSPEERTRVLEAVNRPEFADRSPQQIVPRLADQGEYLGSESTVYRILREGVDGDELTLHSDNGAPMKGATMLATLQRLGVIPSFSRPSVSNDNPYSEALFRTLKYAPVYPEGPFESLEAARAWIAGFVPWYDEQHGHSGIQFVTPGQRHRGEAVKVLRQRTAIYETARAQNPLRWSGDIRNWQPVGSVSLNPGKPSAQEGCNSK